MTPEESADVRYRQILDTAPDAILVVDRSGTIQLVNLQTERIFGYSRTELIGQSLEVLIPERFRGAHGGHVSKYFHQPRIRSMGSGLELFGRRADGSELAIEVSLGPVETEQGMLVSAAIRDISDRKRLEFAAKLAAERLASAVESIQDAFALFDAEDRLVLCNSVYRTLVGATWTGPLLGTTYPRLLDHWIGELSLSPDRRDSFRAERLAERASLAATYDVRTSDGRSLRVSDRRTAEGGIVTTIWDLTDDEKKSEDLRQARASAESASAAKSEFLRSMSHELRTPLNAILGFAQLLQRDKKEPLSERHKDRARHILKGGEHLLRLIDDILDLSRIEAGGISMSTEPVDVAVALEEVRTTLEPTATRSGVSLTVSPPPANLPEVQADRTRFLQILMNYGSNAIKYNRSGGHVVLVASVVGGFVRVTVEDTGLGIPEDKHDKLFQPFQRAGQETGPIEGTGIGLAITKRLAELMGGSVGFRSRLALGSAFWVDIPVRDPEALHPSTSKGSDSERRIRGEHRGLVLYVEDNPANVAFMEDLLGGFENLALLTAPTAEMGVELARARKPHVVLMDINLPGMSGLDALRMLRQYDETKDIPVIALTAAASDRDRARGERAGFYRYLTKPVQVDELEAALEEILPR